MTLTDPTPEGAASDDRAGKAELLRVTGLVKHFPIRKGLLQRQVAAVQAVDGLDFSVREGETLSLVGESGCGKSTTGRLITRLEEPTAGKIVFEGSDITHLKDGAMRPLRRDIQMIFQDPYSSLNPRHTVGKIVGAPYRLQEVTPEGGVKKAVQDLLELVGLNPEHYNRYPHEFSGGQRQRIGIARTLALKPRLIVADEPVSALDVSIQAQVVNLLEDLQEELGLTYVMIAHDLSVVRHVSDRVAVMYLGKIVEIADRDDLYDQPMHPYTVALMSAVPDPGHQAASRARPDPAAGRRALTDQPAAGLPLPHPLLEGAGHLQDRRAAAARAGPAALGRLPLPGERAGYRGPVRVRHRLRRGTDGAGQWYDGGRRGATVQAAGVLAGCLAGSGMIGAWSATTTTTSMRTRRHGARSWWGSPRSSRCPS